MKTFNFKKYKSWTIYLIVLPVILILTIGVEYLLNVKETLNGSFKYEFMFGADSIPIPWFMKTKDLYIKYCLLYGSSLILIVIGYLLAIFKRNKIIQIVTGIIVVLILIFEQNVYFISLP
ncbi:hypothetical protein [Brumimicrobium mesophilum]|uniref:hypothetical protein n=1 Tax=Brumimicrobium mesophilum TaxID=392717 RepID=UPI000D13EF07|nr:hypothetical protein [Brumimicrobium mesophilum]